MKTIELKPFAVLVDDFKHFHAIHEFFTPAIDAADEFFEALAHITSHRSVSNTQAFLNILKTPYLQGIERQEHLEFVETLRIQVKSHLCAAQHSHFQQADQIVVDVKSCSPKDVIVWADSMPLIVDRISPAGTQAKTSLFTKDSNPFSLFMFGMKNIPHYVLGQYVL